MNDEKVPLNRDLAHSLDAVLFARDCGIEPDEWQRNLLTTTSKKILVNVSRQLGKSTITAIRALHHALYESPAMVIAVSPSQLQSQELYKKIAGFLERLPGAPKANQQTLTRMELSNGSRIISLPGSSVTTRGYSGATLVVIDEASRVDDELFTAVRPMLATTNGAFIAMSTPAGKRGWWYEAFTTGGDSWERVMVRATECPRISAEFLAEERAALGPLRFAQEYECSFIDDSTQVFASELIERAIRHDLPPFFVS